MSLKVVTDKVDDVLIVRVIGELIYKDATDQFREMFRLLTERHEKKVVLNCSGITKIDCPGKGEIIVARTSIENIGGRIKFVHLQPKIRQVLELTKLTACLDVQPTEQQAIASFVS